MMCSELEEGALMIRRSTTLGLALSTVLLAACQTGPGFMSRPALTMDGRWASGDGVFVATFNNSSFTSLDARTNAVLAQGSYSVQGNQVSMNWVSATANLQRSALCTFVSANSVTCDQPGATPFQLNRV